MHLPKFEHKRPTSLEETLALLKEYGPRARLVAGGTDLYPRMKYNLLCPEMVIGLKGIPVRPPAVEENGDLHLDALMTLADVVRSPVVSERIPLLAEAAMNVASNQIRHMGTLGGNLCLETRCTYYNQSHTFQYVDPCFKRHGDRCYLIPKGKKCQAVFMADTVPALICLGAKIETRSNGESRQLELEEIYTGDSVSPLGLSEGEIVSEVIVPGPGFAGRTGFAKFSMRGGMEFGAVTLAVLLEMADDRATCDRARIAVGSVAAKPVRAVKGEAAMIGQKLSDELLRDVAKKVAAEIRPVMHHGYSVPFLRACLEVQAYRTLTTAAGGMRKD